MNIPQYPVFNAEDFNRLRGYVLQAEAMQQRDWWRDRCNELLEAHDDFKDRVIEDNAGHMLMARIDALSKSISEANK